MNSLKNIIVTATLLAVGYGAYVVLNNPPSAETGQMADDEWATEVPTMDEADVSVGTEVPIDETSIAAAPATQPPQQTQVSEADWPVADAGTDAPAGTQSQVPAPSRPTDQRPAQSALATDEAQGFYTQTTSHGSESLDPATTGGEADSGFEQAWAAVASHLKSAAWADALFALSMWYGDVNLTDEQATRCQRLLDQLAGTVVYSNESYIEPEYIVQPGETLDQIARSHNVTAELLARINGIGPSDQLVAGESMKVLRGPFRAEVNLSRGELSVFLGRYYAGRFPAHFGSKVPVADAVYTVVEKSQGREFFDLRSGYRVSSDDPNNPYGNRWIGLRGDQVTAGDNVGIHVWNAGISAESSIGLDPVDADDVSVILSVGSRVSVTR